MKTGIGRRAAAGVVILLSALIVAGVLANRQALVPAPVIWYNPESRCSGLAAVTDADNNAAIQISLDGGDPINTGWSYRHPFTVYAGTTIKARAHDRISGFSPLVAMTITCAAASGR